MSPLLEENKTIDQMLMKQNTPLLSGLALMTIIMAQYACFTYCVLL